MSAGEMVYGLVVVDPSYRLRANHSLTVFEVHLCRSTAPPLSCKDRPGALTVLVSESAASATDMKLCDSVVILIC